MKETRTKMYRLSQPIAFDKQHGGFNTFSHRTSKLTLDTLSFCYTICSLEGERSDQQVGYVAMY